MCCTNIALTIFVVLLGGATVLTVAAFVTPGWSKIYLDESTQGKVHSGDGDYVGLFSGCPEAMQEGGGCILKDMSKLRPWQKLVLAGMIAALLLELAAIVWSVVACTACCCKSCLTPPLPVLCALAAAALGLAVGVYAKESGVLPDIEESVQQGQVPYKLKETEAGYSVYMAGLACVAMIANTVVGVFVVRLSKALP